MQTNVPLDALPLWGLFIAILLVALLSVECGYRIGKYRRSRSEQEKEAPVGTMVGATLGLLAFILAFTFGLAAARFDTRRQVLLDEANAIGTTYLRAGILPERAEEIRALLRDYVSTRLEAVRSGNIAAGIPRSEDIQHKVWAQAEAVGEKTPNSIVVGLFVQSLNEVSNHTSSIYKGAEMPYMKRVTWGGIALHAGNLPGSALAETVHLFFTQSGEESEPIAAGQFEWSPDKSLSG
jgi:hypothetical protein